MIKALLLSLLAAVVVVPAASQAMSQCLDDTSPMVNNELTLTDYSVRRVYTICPNTDVFVGVLDQSGAIVGGSFPILIGPNATVKCGDDGSRANNCRITGGSFGMFLQAISAQVASVDGSEIIGITFEDLISAPFFSAGVFGTLKMIDCAFLNSISGPNIYIQGLTISSPARERRLRIKLNEDEPDFDFEAFDKEVSRRKLQQRGIPVFEVQFINTDFKLNQGIRGAVTDVGSNMIIMPEPDVAATFVGCVFEDNDYSVETPGEFFFRSLVYTYFDSNPLNFTSNCFINNQVVTLGLVLVFGDVTKSVTATDNYVTPLDPSLACSFASGFSQNQTDGSIFSTGCIDFDASVCTPLLVPSDPPSAGPSAMPSIPSPTAAPVTPAPTPAPVTPAPTIAATPAPTASGAISATGCLFFAAASCVVASLVSL